MSPTDAFTTRRLATSCLASSTICVSVRAALRFLELAAADGTAETARLLRTEAPSLGLSPTGAVQSPLMDMARIPATDGNGCGPMAVTKKSGAFNTVALTEGQLHTVWGMVAWVQQVASRGKHMPVDGK